MELEFGAMLNSLRLTTEKGAAPQVAFGFRSAGLSGPTPWGPRDDPHRLFEKLRAMMASGRVTLIVISEVRDPEAAGQMELGEAPDEAEDDGAVALTAEEMAEVQAAAMTTAENGLEWAAQTVDRDDGSYVGYAFADEAEIEADGPATVPVSAVLLEVVVVEAFDGETAGDFQALMSQIEGEVAPEETGDLDPALLRGLVVGIGGEPGGNTRATRPTRMVITGRHIRVRLAGAEDEGDEDGTAKPDDDEGEDAEGDQCKGAEDADEEPVQ